jgi:RimJ/RimL family protein N-acetyltransferase
MSSIVRRLNEALLDPILHGHPKQAVDEIARWVNSESYYWGLKRDLDVDFESAPAKIPVEVRPLTNQDIEAIAKISVTEDERLQFNRRVAFMRDGVRTGFVAVSEANEPGYIQWLIGSGDNAFIRSQFHGLFPTLAKNEALLEYAFTFPNFRGMGLMPRAMDLIARKGAEIGARYVITIVSEHNVPALKGCERAGFAPYMVIRDRWRFFRRTVENLPLADGPQYPLR